jgi:hypothetical protein
MNMLWLAALLPATFLGASILLSQTNVLLPCPQRCASSFDTYLVQNSPPPDAELVDLRAAVKNYGNMPNFVARHPTEPFVCKCYSFENVPAPLVLASFLLSTFSSIVSLSTPLPVPTPLQLTSSLTSIAPYYVGHHALAPDSRSLRCSLLSAGFVDLDSHTFSNAITTVAPVPPHSFQSLLVDVDTLIPVYLYLPLMAAINFFDVPITVALSPVTEAKVESGCLDELPSFPLALTYLPQHAYHAVRGAATFSGLI